MDDYFPLVSVVVPVYNDTKVVSACIESILEQTYCNLQVIFVDDGSNDKSSETCLSYLLQDDRVELVDKMNSGVSMARNTALFIAKGEYVCFVDSDDIISPYYVEKMVRLARGGELI